MRAVCPDRDRPVCGRVGRVITLNEVPDALELVRKSDGPPRIIVHPNGGSR